ncbi:MAG TPA: MJ0042-type zinc finger domain-containing protein [Bradyrhizobium sp.]
MHIMCPHCTTSYAIDLATLGTSGRTVRCSRCKEVWLARPEEAIEVDAPMAVTAAADGDDVAAEWERMADEDADQQQGVPVVDSPSISADWPEDGASQPDWSSAARDDSEHIDAGAPRRVSWLRNLFKPRPRAASRPRRHLPIAALPTTCAAMGALVLALVIWRADVVRLLPQTATFYKMVGLEVNLRGLMFKDVKISHETVDGKPVLVIEGVITGEARKAVELPRLRFSVRDAQGAEIYAWNAVLEQSILKPGEKAWFKSRLASPPPEGRNIDVRFFNKRDIAGGNA